MTIVYQYCMAYYQSLILGICACLLLVCTSVVLKRFHQVTYIMLKLFFLKFYQESASLYGEYQVLGKCWVGCNAEVSLIQLRVKTRLYCYRPGPYSHTAVVFLVPRAIIERFHCTKWIIYCAPKWKLQFSSMFGQCWLLMYFHREQLLQREVALATSLRNVYTQLGTIKVILVFSIRKYEPPH